MQRCIKLKIIRPYDEKLTWDDVGYLLRGLSYKVCKISNYCMTHHLLRALNLETENLNPQGNLYCYPRLAKEYPDVPTGIICAAEGRARKVFRQNAEGILRSQKALPTFRKNSSIPLPVAGYNLLKVGEDTYVANIQLLSRQAAKTGKLPGRIQLVVANNWRDKKADSVLHQLADGSLKQGVAVLFRAKKDWYISIPYEIEANEKREGFEPGLVMGVAFGTKCSMAYAFNHLLKRGELGGEEILSHQKKLLGRKMQIMKQYNWSGRKGHGRENALKPLRLLEEKERNYRDLTNERYAKWIVEIAKKNRCGVIRLEEDSKRDIMLSYWPRAALRKKIRDKAEAYGIEVQECAADKIQFRCSRCGAAQEPAEGNRWFICNNCGYGKEEKKTASGFVSVDHNAARNLAVWEE